MRRVAHVLLHAGIVATVLGLSKVHASLVASPPYDFTASFRFSWAFIYAAILAVCAYGAGLPDLPRGRRSAIATSLAAVALAVASTSLLYLLSGDAFLPRFVLLGSAVVLAAWFTLCSFLAAGGARIAGRRDNVVVVGDWADAEDIRAELDRGAERPAVVQQVFSVAEAGSTGSSRPLVEQGTGATVLVLDRAAQIDERIVDQVATLHEGGARVRTLSLFYEEWLGKLPVAELERVSLMFDIGAIHRRRYNRLKRVIDLAVAIAAVPAFLLAVPLVILGNVAGNRGPLFYRQIRVGLNGELFEILKFRTMTPEPDGGLPDEWTEEDDPRITPFGQFLRRTHLDEVPQVLNVLRGDLSIVGPRPEQPHYVTELSEKLPFYDLRHLVRPGITGWAQVKYGYAGNEQDALEKLQYDFYYLRRQSTRFDLRVIARTLRSVVRSDGR